MGVSKKLGYAKIDELFLDPKNPRLGRNITQSKPAQGKILSEIVDSWSIEELATSFLESGFWTQEALIVIKDNIDNQECLVVVEGNRRLAALKTLKNTFEGVPQSKAWSNLIQGHTIEELPEKIPYVIADSRHDVLAYLGFRHVTGIKEWKPAEKAEFIAHMIDENSMTYEDVMRQIGSKVPTVRQNYVAYRLFLQMGDNEDIEIEEVEDKFSVLYLSLRTAGVQDFLGIDIKADPEKARTPVSADKTGNLVDYSKWLFGTKNYPPLISDSRKVDKFGEILLKADAIRYLKTSKNPRFDMAYEIAGGNAAEVFDTISRAKDEVRLALTSAHRYTKDDKIMDVVSQFAQDAIQLIKLFPEIYKSIRD